MKLESTLERASLTAAKAHGSHRLPRPGLAAHGITPTLAAANHTSGSPLAEGRSDRGMRQARRGSGSGDTGVSSGQRRYVYRYRASSYPRHDDLRQASYNAAAPTRARPMRRHGGSRNTNGTMTRRCPTLSETLGGDLGEALNGYRDPTSQAAEQAVRTGCAAAGVKMPYRLHRMKRLIGPAIVLLIPQGDQDRNELAAPGLSGRAVKCHLFRTGIRGLTEGLGGCEGRRASCAAIANGLLRSRHAGWWSPSLAACGCRHSHEGPDGVPSRCWRVRC